MDTEAGETATEDHLNQFLAERMASLAARATKRKPLGRCEVLTGGWFVDDPDDMPCRRFAEVERDGHHVCHIHKNQMRNGKKLAFSPEDAHAPIPYVIWARSPAELIAQATMLAGPASALAPLPTHRDNLSG